MPSGRVGSSEAHKGRALGHPGKSKGLSLQLLVTEGGAQGLAQLRPCDFSTHPSRALSSETDPAQRRNSETGIRMDQVRDSRYRRGGCRPHTEDVLRKERPRVLREQGTLSIDLLID